MVRIVLQHEKSSPAPLALVHIQYRAGVCSTAVDVDAARRTSVALRTIGDDPPGRRVESELLKR
jgi:hypothetical protein